MKQIIFISIFIFSSCVTHDHRSVAETVDGIIKCFEANDLQTINSTYLRLEDRISKSEIKKLETQLNNRCCPNEEISQLNLVKNSKPIFKSPNLIVYDLSPNIKPGEQDSDIFKTYMNFVKIHDKWYIANSNENLNEIEKD